jgi:hypothetical protein
MILTWPSYILSWPDICIVEFPDEPKVWWWTDTFVLLRGVGEKPDGYSGVKPKKEFSQTAMLDVRRTPSKWEHCLSRWSHIEECVRSLKNNSHGLDVKYHRLPEHWAKPVKWLVPVKGDNWSAPSLAVEAESQQIVAVVMPMKGAEKWEAR